MVLLEGKKVLENKEAHLLSLSNELSKKYGKRPCLAIISLELKQASATYIEKIKKMCDKFNIDVKHFNFQSEQEFINTFDSVVFDENISAIMLQEPIDSKYKELFGKIDSQKDVEGITKTNLGNLVLNSKNKIVPCTAQAVLDILDFYNVELKSKKVVILGRSNIVGRPLALELISRDATVTVCHSKTIDVKRETKSADIVIVAIGKANYLTSEYVKDGACIIDVGINFINKKIIGDVDFESVKGKASMITPVPGGVGIVTNCCLIENILKIFKIQNQNIGENNKNEKDI